MPIYEYACGACGHEFEEWQKMSDPPVRTCPKCKKKKVEKLISHTAFQLKGGGWYADLYSSSKPGDGKSSEAKAAKESGSSKESGGSSDAGSKDAASAKEPRKESGKDTSKDTKKKDSPKKSESRAA